jgi:ABC-2 type transport system permease protein
VWLAAGVGAATGGVAMFVGRIVAVRALERRGAELLHVMRSGAARRTAASRRFDAIFTVTAVGGLIALFPQALVPAVFKLGDASSRLWFLALYVPEPWQWPCIVVMAGIGAGALVVAWRIRQGARHPR